MKAGILNSAFQEVKIFIIAAKCLFLPQTSKRKDKCYIIRRNGTKKSTPYTLPLSADSPTLQCVIHLISATLKLLVNH